MYILGVNSVYHESSASIIKDGKLIASAEEERFNRFKHGKELRLDNPNELPLHAIAYCLESAGITLKDVEHVGFSINPDRRLSTYAIPDPVCPGDWGSKDGETFFYTNILKVEEQMKAMGFAGEFHMQDHHLCHAASSYFPSSMEESTVIVFDGIGETATTLIAHGKGKELKVLDENLYPASLGFLWEKMSIFLGFSEYDACKVMGLAAYGKSNELLTEAFRKIVHNDGNGKFSIDGDVMRFRLYEDFSLIEQIFQMPRRNPNEPVSDKHMDIAYALQQITEEIVADIADAAYAATNCANLCLAGGVALNCVANRKILERGLYKNMYITPAPHDAGTSLGAALLIWHTKLEQDIRGEVPHAYWGPSYTNTQIEEAIRESGLPYESIHNIEEKVASLLSQGNIVGWFQGAMELGPRALGNRSLLADPRAYNMREKMNRIVKKREDFRPFAPSVLEEEVYQYFDVPLLTNASDFMLVTYPARSDAMDKIPAVVHVDGTSRIQVVKQATNPRYHRLIQQFHSITGVPMVLNTSFNDREPIVCSPRDALRTFLKADIDYLALGDFLLKNPKINRGDESHEQPI